MIINLESHKSVVVAKRGASSGDGMWVTSDQRPVTCLFTFMPFSFPGGPGWSKVVRIMPGGSRWILSASCSFEVDSKWLLCNEKALMGLEICLQ